MKTEPSVDTTLAALSDPTRRAVIDLLRVQPRRAGELAEALAMNAAALSRHLRVLRKSGLIVDDEVEHDARVRLYRLKPDAFVSLREWLNEVESFWGDQLQSFKRHAERRQHAGRACRPHAACRDRHAARAAAPRRRAGRSVGHERRCVEPPPARAAQERLDRGRRGRARRAAEKMSSPTTPDHPACHGQANAESISRIGLWWADLRRSLADRSKP